MEKIKRLLKQVSIIYFILTFLDVVTAFSSGALKLFNTTYLYLFIAVFSLYFTYKIEKKDN